MCVSPGFRYTHATHAKWQKWRFRFKFRLRMRKKGTSMSDARIYASNTQTHNSSLLYVDCFVRSWKTNFPAPNLDRMLSLLLGRSLGKEIMTDYACYLTFSFLCCASSFLSFLRDLCLFFDLSSLLAGKEKWKFAGIRRMLTTHHMHDDDGGSSHT